MDQSQLAITFVTLGGLLIAGLAAQWLGARTAIPRVTLLIALGVAAGPTGADVIGDVAGQTFPWISYITLAMVGFLLGGKLHLRALRSQANAVVASSLWITLCTWPAVALGSGLLTGDWALAIILGAIATATARFMPYTRSSGRS